LVVAKGGGAGGDGDGACAKAAATRPHAINKPNPATSTRVIIFSMPRCYVRF
jgi:hypothetical protein